jgi:hypothetical protein
VKTEAEAKKCWCPFARISSVFGQAGGAAGSSPTAAVAYNRSANSPHVVAPCIASDCMAWRWGTFAEEARKEGFCGLAATP